LLHLEDTMKIKIIWLLGAILTLAVLFSGCGRNETDQTTRGSRSAPLLPGETITYNGMASRADYAKCVVEITYEDVVRGHEAMDIFLSGGYYVTTELIPEGKELVLVKMTLNVLATKDDLPLILDDDGIPFFQVVSGGGIFYKPFHDQAHVEQNLFSKMYPGAQQTAHRFFMVDEADPDPLMVVYPEVGGGIWFSLTVGEDQRIGDRIDHSEWNSATVHINNSDFSRFGISGDFAGTLSDPLPMGHWGLFRGDEFTLNNILEIKLESVERGEVAANRLLSTSDYHDARLTDSQEIMAIELHINVLHNIDDTGVMFFSHNFELITPERRSVEVNMPYNTSTDNLPTAFPGASYSGWAFFIVEKQDRNLLISPSSFSGDRLWMSTDPDASFPAGKEEYIPQYDSSIGHRDPGEPLGSMRNPIPAGTAGEVEVGAVLATRNNMSYDFLEGHDPGGLFSRSFTEGNKIALARDWGITNRFEATEMMDSLVDGRHHKPHGDNVGYDYIFAIATGRQTPTAAEKLLYADRIAAVEAVTEALTSDFGYTQAELARITTVSAWDYDRLVTVSRMCYSSGYFTEEQTWAYITKAAAAGSADYDDWRGYFAGVMYGRAIWSRHASFNSDNARIATALLLEDSIYDTVFFIAGVAV
jgi:hypothetical protein